MSWGKYIYSKELNLAYIDLPKCACTSIKLAMAQYKDPSVKRIGIRDRIYELCDDLSFCELPTNAFKFTFVRNPTERFISFYKDKVFTKNCKVTTDLSITFEMNINDVIDIIIKHDPKSHDSHLKPQSLFLFNDGKLMVDFIGRLEQMENHWNIINKVCCTGMKLGHENKSHQENLRVIDPEHIRKLHEYYADDFRLLGYEYECLSS